MKAQMSLRIRAVWSVFVIRMKKRCIIDYHYENTPIQIYWKFNHKKKNESFQIKILIFFIFLLKT